MLKQNIVPHSLKSKNSHEIFEKARIFLKLIISHLIFDQNIDKSGLFLAITNPQHVHFVAVEIVYFQTKRSN